MILDVLPSMLLLFPLYLGAGAFLSHCLKRWEKQYVREDSLSFLFGVWFLLGAGGTLFWEVFLSFAGMPFWLSLICEIPISLAGFILERGTILRFLKNKHSLVKTSYWVGIVLILSLFFTRSISRVMYTWDTAAFWIPKMFVLWNDQKIKMDGLIHFNHPEYPLLLPLMGANAFTIAGGPNEIAAKAVFFGFTFAIVLLTGSFLLRTVGTARAAFWMTLLLSLFVFREHVAGEYVGTADVFMGIYLAAGAMLLLSKRTLEGYTAWMFAASAKSEGLVFAGIVSALMFVWYPQYRKWFVSLFSLLVLPWQVFVRAHGVSSSQYFKFGEIYARPWLEYTVYSIHAFREEFRNLTKWNLLFFMYFSVTLTRIREIWRQKELRVIYGGLIAQLIVYMVIFTVTPEEQASFIAAAVSRLTLHLAIAALVVTAYISGKSHEGTHESAKA